MKLEIEGDDHVIIGLTVVVVMIICGIWALYSYQVKSVPFENGYIQVRTPGEVIWVKTNTPVILEETHDKR